MKIKKGWIESFNKSEITCLLREEFECDERLIFPFFRLSEHQQKMVSVGLVIKYNKTNSTVKFLLEDGKNWL